MSQFTQASVVRVSYRYNTRSERVATTEARTMAIDNYALYDGADNWIGDYDTTGAPEQQAVWFCYALGGHCGGQRSGLDTCLWPAGSLGHAATSDRPRTQCGGLGV